MSSANENDDSPRNALTVGAVVTNHNGGEGVIRTIESLLANAIPIECIVVIDNASSDGSPDGILSRFADIDVIRLPANCGPCVSRNKGLAHLTTALAVLIDDDVTLEPFALSKLLDAYRLRRCAILFPRVVFDPRGDIIQADGGGAHFLGTLILNSIGRPRDEITTLSDPPEGITVGAGISACMLVEREALLSIGAFDELYFFYFEDLEVSLRSRACGYELRCLRDAVARHDRGRGTPGLSFRGDEKYPEQRFYLSNRNRLLTIFAHFRLSTLLLLAPTHVVYELVVLAFAIRLGLVRAWLRSWSWQLDHVSEIRDRRSRMLACRQRSDRDLLCGGDIPVAPGLIGNVFVSYSLKVLSRVLSGYWAVVRPLLR